MYYGSQLMNHSEGLPQLSIVGQLGGELGNYLCRIGHAFVIWRKLQNNHPQFDYRIVLRHGSKREWPGKFLRVKPDIDRCFPVLRKFDLGQANVPEFDSRLEEQEKLGWMQDFSKINQNPSSVLPALANFTQIATNFRQDTGQSAISMPFLLSDSYVGFSGFIEYADEYYEELRRIFEIDEKIEACCALRPDPDETVFVSSHHDVTSELLKLFTVQSNHISSKATRWYLLTVYFSRSTIETFRLNYPSVPYPLGWKKWVRIKRHMIYWDIYKQGTRWRSFLALVLKRSSRTLMP
jgi:hypothetical protein